jgi:hypothetical protein
VHQLQPKAAEGLGERDVALHVEVRAAPPEDRMALLLQRHLPAAATRGRPEDTQLQHGINGGCGEAHHHVPGRATGDIVALALEADALAAVRTRWDAHRYDLLDLTRRVGLAVPPARRARHLDLTASV